MICSKCGIPEGIGAGNVWGPGGTITGKYPPHIRGAFFDVDELNNLFSSISERIGFDVSPIVTEGKHKDAKRYMSSLISRMREVGSEPSLPLLVDLFTIYTRIWGLADIRVLRAEPHVAAKMEVNNPYSIPLFLGDVAGVSEVVEGRRVMAYWEGEEDRGVIQLDYAEEQPELEKRIEADIEAGIESEVEGEISYDRCPGCGAPRDISETFDWDLERATITERATGKRFVLTNANGIVAVIRQLLAELGEEVSGLVLEIGRDYARKLYSESAGVFSLEHVMGGFPLKGWGVPETPALRGRDIVMTVGNPYSYHMVAGRAWGMLEAYTEEALTLDFMPSEGGVLIMTFHRAGNGQ